MSTSTQPQPRIPDPLRQTMVDLTIGYLLERPRPSNLVDYAVKFFRKLNGEPEPEQPEKLGSGSSEPGTAEAEGATTTAPPQIKTPSMDGNGGKLELDEASATWMFHMAARYVLEEPEDIAEWGLQYCLNEQGRYMYP